MRNLKKILSLVLALMMVLSVMATASATSFVDDEDITYKEAVEVMSGLGVLNGVPNADGTFNFLPKESLNREAAAKIVAYIKLGGDVDATLADALPNPFSDVSGWSETVIKYCASEGIIDGVGDGTFLPKGELNGYSFAKMLLVAAGINGEYTGSNWKINIATAAQRAGFLKGLENVALSDTLTREQACQMAFNAMNYSATGVTSQFVVTKGTTELYRGTDAMSALVYSQIAGTTLTTEQVSTGSLMDVVFGAKSSSSTDAFGRTSKTWISKTDGTKVYAEMAATPAKTYTTGTSFGKIFSDLGYTKTTQNITLKVFNNSATGTGNTVTKGDVTPVGGQGTLVEVYKTAANAYDVVVIDSYAVRLDTANIVAAVPATSTTDAVPAYVWIDLNGNTTEDPGEAFVTNSFKKDDVVLYTVADGKLVNVVKADSFSGKVTSTAAAAGYFRVDGEKKVLAANNSAVIGTTAGYAYDATTTYTYYVDAYGNVIYAVAGVVSAPDVDYIYVISEAAKAATTKPGDLYGEGSTTAAAAQAMVMDLKTGTISIKNQGVVKGTDGKYYYATATGAASSAYVVDKDVTLVEGLYEYTELADGSIVIGSAATTAGINLVKGQADVGLVGKFANASTVVNVLTYTKDANGNYTSVEQTSYTGIANFPANGVAYTNALVAADPTNGVISSITVVKAPDPVVTTPDYAVYAGLGEMGAKGQAYAFVLNGELVNYYLAKGVTTTAAGLDALTAGDVVTLTLTNGALGTGAASKEIKMTSGKVTYVDDTFMVIGGAVYYFLENTEVYYVASNGSLVADSVAVGDTVNVYGGVGLDGLNYACYILK